MNNRNGALALPGQINLSLDFVNGHTAQPVQINAMAPGQIMSKVFGGLTKLEHFVAQIAGDYKDIDATDVVRRAQELLAACAAADKESQNGEAPTGSAAAGNEPPAPGDSAESSGGVSPGGIVLP